MRGSHSGNHTRCERELLRSMVPSFSAEGKLGWPELWHRCAKAGLASHLGLWLDKCHDTGYVVPMSIDSSTIRELRESSELSQEAFARLIGVSVRTIARWESGSSSPSPLALEKLQVKVLRQSKGVVAHGS
jgi:DNA-binding XRE family transcriptional regulator